LQELQPNAPCHPPKTVFPSRLLLAAFSSSLKPLE
jgi:hypothetical protein